MTPKITRNATVLNVTIDELPLETAGWSEVARVSANLRA
jgi:hypothetical protein